MKVTNPTQALSIAGLCAALFFGLVSTSGADDGRIIAKCRLVEESYVKTVHYDVKARNLRWQVSKKAGKYPWVRARLTENPAGELIPETALAKNEAPQRRRKRSWPPCSSWLWMTGLSTLVK